MQKKLMKSATDKKLGGVCGGIAQYFDIDSTIVRLIWVVFTLMGGAGLLAYIVAALIIPEAGSYNNDSNNDFGSDSDDQ